MTLSLFNLQEEDLQEIIAKIASKTTEYEEGRAQMAELKAQYETAEREYRQHKETINAAAEEADTKKVEPRTLAGGRRHGGSHKAHCGSLPSCDRRSWARRIRKWWSANITRSTTKTGAASTSATSTPWRQTWPAKSRSFRLGLQGCPF